MDNVNITVKPETQQSNNLLLNLLVLFRKTIKFKNYYNVFLFLEQMWPSGLTFSLSALFEQGREQIKIIKHSIAQLKILICRRTSVYFRMIYPECHRLVVLNCA